MLMLHLIGVVLLARYLYKEFKAQLLARCSSKVCTEADYTLLLNAVHSHRKYVSRKLRAEYPFLFPLSALFAIGVFVLFSGVGIGRGDDTGACISMCNNCTTCHDNNSAVLSHVMPMIQQQRTSTPVLDFRMNHCLSTSPPAPSDTRNATPVYCYVTRAWQQPVASVQYGGVVTVTDDDRTYFVDSERKLYTTLRTSYWLPIDTLADTSTTEQHATTTLTTGPNIVGESTLKHWLLQNRPDGGCVCAEQLGIYDNVSFMYYHNRVTGTSQWTVLFEPTIVTGGGIARQHHRRRVKHTVMHDSRFPVTVEHDDVFTVSFASSQFKFSSDYEVDELVMYDGKISALLRQQQKHRPHNETQKAVLRYIPAEKMTRIALELSGESATCFTYCLQYPYHQYQYHHHTVLRGHVAPP
jgi:hypothetical protein